jgi:hypothetical protein
MAQKSKERQVSEIRMEKRGYGNGEVVVVKGKGPRETQAGKLGLGDKGRPGKTLQGVASREIELVVFSRLAKRSPS